MMEKKNIPSKWSQTTVDFVGEFLRGINYNKLDSSQYKQEGYLPILRSNNIQEALIFEDLVYVDTKNFNVFHSLKKGDILFAMSSGSKHLVGKTAKVELDCEYGWGAFCAVLRPFEILNKKFVAYFFKAPDYKKLVSEISKGTNINNLKKEHILDLQFPLPPLAEQQRIVEKIEELFSELDKGIESLKTAQQQLKVYRQAVLKYAFEGKLTNPNVKEGELPEGWVLKNFGDCTINHDGKRVPLSKLVRSTRKGEFRYYGATEVVDFIDDYIFDGRFLLIGEDGANLLSKSKPLAHITEGKFWVNNHAHVVQSKENISIDYLCHFFNSLHLDQYVTGTAQPKLTQANLNKIPISIPIAQLEQIQIVQEIESRLSVCDKIEESIEQGLQQAEALRQSILKKAFEGKLVPQDPNDEPASVLLDRIKAARAGQTATKKSRTKKDKV